MFMPMEVLTLVRISRWIELRPMTAAIWLTALVSAVFLGASVHAQESNADYEIDYSLIMPRAFGVPDEPSILVRCESDFGGIRVFEHAGGRALALVRVEKIGGRVLVIKRTYDHGHTSKSEQVEISESDWNELSGLLETSGFWTYEMDEGLWMPDRPILWIEACVVNRFRSVSLYPERTDLAAEILQFLADSV